MVRKNNFGWDTKKLSMDNPENQRIYNQIIQEERARIRRNFLGRTVF